VRDNYNDPTPYAVICLHDCGLQFLDELEYTRQLNRPDSLWVCPKCGRIANWDDDCQVTNPPDEDAPQT
jgi:hypothetical protein